MKHWDGFIKNFDLSLLKRKTSNLQGTNLKWEYVSSQEGIHVLVQILLESVKYRSRMVKRSQCASLVSLFL